MYFLYVCLTCVEDSLVLFTALSTDWLWRGKSGNSRGTSLAAIICSLLSFSRMKGSWMATWDQSIIWSQVFASHCRGVASIFLIPLSNIFLGFFRGLPLLFRILCTAFSLTLLFSEASMAHSMMPTSANQALCCTTGFTTSLTESGCWLISWMAVKMAGGPYINLFFFLRRNQSGA